MEEHLPNFRLDKKTAIITGGLAISGGQYPKGWLHPVPTSSY